MPSWRLCVTTAPRGETFLGDTLRSLFTAGWSEDEIWIAAEPGSNLNQVFGCRIIRRPDKLGAWLNWRAGVTDLLIESNQAKCLAMVQDDIVVVPDLRARLEEVLDGEAVYSAFTSVKDHKKLQPNAGWQISKAGFGLCGAQFFAATREIWTQVEEKLPDKVPRNQAIDAWFAEHLRKIGMPLMLHAPSLVDHLGDVVSL